MRNSRLILLATVAVAMAGAPVSVPLAQAQQGGSQQWFVPGGGGGGQQPRSAQPRPPAPRPQAVAPSAMEPPAGDEPEPPPLQVQLPPVPELPPLARGATPPATVMGVISVRDVFRSSAAAQQVERIMGERREKFQQDVQKEQAAWREMQQAFAGRRANMTPEQIRAEERKLQDRVTNAQRQFRDRQRILQQATEYAGSQIERATIMVVRQVAESRGINVVMHREQIVLNTPEFELTETVIQQLNKMLPTVVIPPDGVSLANFPPAIPPAAGQAPAAGGAPGGPSIAPVNAAPPAPAPAPAPATAAPPRR